MKKIFYIIVLIIFSLYQPFAQDVGNFKSGSVPKVKYEKSHSTIEKNQNAETIGYAYASVLGYTLSVPGTCGFSLISPWSSPGYMSSMCMGGDGNYYATNHSDPSLYQFDPLNGSFIFLGNISGLLPGELPNGISYNTINSTYYICTSLALYSFDITTRAAQYIGSFNTGGIMIDLCFDENGICYAYDIGVDNAYKINIVTGSVTLLGPLGYDANFGQGMSYDYQTNTIFLSAFNNSTATGQCRIMNPVTGMTTLLTDWGYEQIDAFALAISQIPPCPVGAPSNPNPPNGATYVPVYGTTVSWSNGAGTTNIELWFGPIGNVVKTYDDPAITSFALPTLNYSTIYQWYVVCKDATCGTQGPNWAFTTIQDPNPQNFCDGFNNMSNWNVIGPLGLTNWSASNSSFAGGTAPELRMNWTPSFYGESKIRSVSFPFYGNQCGLFTFRFYFDWFADPSGIVTVGITYDGGATSTSIYTLENSTGNVGPIYFYKTFGTTSTYNQYAQIEISYSGNSYNVDFIYWDNVCIDYLLSDMCPPGAPGNLTSQVIFDPGPKVQLGWQDNTWNEAGFNVLRKNGQPNDPGDYVLVGTAGQNQIQYTDATVAPESTYTYRVFAYNQYGENGSNTATIAVPVPVELISFTADVDENVVTLFWQTATETNNQGFEIERAPSKSPPKGETSGWQRIGFVEGKGTTTEIQSYSFTDKPEPGIYKYRLKQIDYDGTFAYSAEVEAEVKAPNVFSLEQNYPNPFNPSTKIKYTIPASSQSPFSKGEGTLVTLKVYDILGNEVATLVNEEQAPGVYEVEFNSVGTSRDLFLSSGIYFYTLRAGEFIQTKKMILLK